MKKSQNIACDTYQEVCDKCKGTKFFLYCLQRGEHGTYCDVRAVCINCGRVLDIDDFVFNKKLNPIK